MTTQFPAGIDSFDIRSPQEIIRAMHVNDIQEAIVAIEVFLLSLNESFNNHVNQIVDAHDASSISVTSSSALVSSPWPITATNVQEALEQLKAVIIEVSNLETDLAAFVAHLSTDINTAHPGLILGTKIADSTITIEKLAFDVATQQELDAHIASLTAHNASQIVVSPTISGQADVQSALNALDTILSSHLSLSEGVHGISNSQSGTGYSGAWPLLQNAVVGRLDKQIIEQKTLVSQFLGSKIVLFTDTVEDLEKEVFAPYDSSASDSQIVVRRPSATRVTQSVSAGTSVTIPVVNPSIFNAGDLVRARLATAYDSGSDILGRITSTTLSSATVEWGIYNGSGQWVPSGSNSVAANSLLINDSITNPLFEVGASGAVKIQNLTVSAGQSFQDNVTIAKNLTVQGNTILGEGGTDSTTINGTVIHTGSASTSGNYSIGGTLTVTAISVGDLGSSGLATLNDVSITGTLTTTPGKNLSIGGNLIVDGYALFNQSLSALNFNATSGLYNNINLPQFKAAFDGHLPSGNQLPVHQAGFQHHTDQIGYSSTRILADTIPLGATGVVEQARLVTAYMPGDGYVSVDRIGALQVGDTVVVGDRYFGFSLPSVDPWPATLELEDNGISNVSGGVGLADLSISTSAIAYEFIATHERLSTISTRALSKTTSGNALLVGEIWSSTGIGTPGSMLAHSVNTVGVNSLATFTSHSIDYPSTTFNFTNAQLTLGQKYFFVTRFLSYVGATFSGASSTVGFTLPTSNGTTNGIGTQFTPNVSGGISSAQARLAKMTASSGTVVAKIFTVDAQGKPNTLLGTSLAVNISSLPATTPDWINFTFNTPVAVINGQEYALTFTWLIPSGEYIKFEYGSYVAGMDFLETSNGSLWNNYAIQTLRFNAIITDGSVQVSGLQTANGAYGALTSSYPSWTSGIDPFDLSLEIAYITSGFTHARTIINIEPFATPFPRIYLDEEAGLDLLTPANEAKLVKQIAWNSELPSNVTDALDTLASHLYDHINKGTPHPGHKASHIVTAPFNFASPFYTPESNTYGLRDVQLVLDEFGTRIYQHLDGYHPSGRGSLDGYYVHPAKDLSYDNSVANISKKFPLLVDGGLGSSTVVVPNTHSMNPGDFVTISDDLPFAPETFTIVSISVPLSQIVLSGPLARNYQTSDNAVLSNYTIETVQEALEALATGVDVGSHINDGYQAHNATAISITGASGMTGFSASNVAEAFIELAGPLWNSAVHKDLYGHQFDLAAHAAQNITFDGSLIGSLISSYTGLAYPTSSYNDVQEALDGAQKSLYDHIDVPTDAHDASAISITAFSSAYFGTIGSSLVNFTTYNYVPSTLGSTAILTTSGKVAQTIASTEGYLSSFSIRVVQSSPSSGTLIARLYETTSAANYAPIEPQLAVTTLDVGTVVFTGSPQLLTFEFNPLSSLDSSKIYIVVVENSTTTDFTYYYNALNLPGNIDTRLVNWEVPSYPATFVNGQHPWGDYSGVLCIDTLSSDVVNLTWGYNSSYQQVSNPVKFSGSSLPLGLSTSTTYYLGRLGSNPTRYLTIGTQYEDFGSGLVWFAGNGSGTWSTMPSTPMWNSNPTNDLDFKIIISSQASTNAVNVQQALEALQDQLDDGYTYAKNNLDNHLADPIDAHDASAISIVPFNNMVATELQTALQEWHPQGDLAETIVNILNNQMTPTDIAGLSFNTSLVRSAHIDYSIYRYHLTPTAELASAGTVRLIYKPQSAVWTLDDTFAGDNVGVTFSVTPAGQVQYVSTDLGSAPQESVIKFRVRVTGA